MRETCVLISLNECIKRFVFCSHILKGKSSYTDVQETKKAWNADSANEITITKKLFTYTSDANTETFRSNSESY